MAPTNLRSSTQFSSLPLSYRPLRSISIFSAMAAACHTYRRVACSCHQEDGQLLSHRRTIGVLGPLLHAVLHGTLDVH